MKGIACQRCCRARVISDEWVEAMGRTLQLPASQDSIEGMVPLLKCEGCGSGELLLVSMEVIPTGRDAPSGHVCIDCGESLTIARVTAMPDATRCPECQSAAERGGGTRTPSGPRPAEPGDGPPLDPGDLELFRTLRAWRLEEARARGIPAFCVLKNSTLYAVAELRPRSLGFLKSIPGFGPHKIQNFGRAVIEIVHEFEAPG